MSNPYPWFKFDAESWLSGNIQFQPPEYQAIFINICCLIWKSKHALALQLLCMRYPHAKQMVTDAVQSLTDAGMIEMDDDQNISVKFITEQIGDTEVRSQKRSDAANKRWNNASAMQVHTSAMQTDAEESKSKSKKRGEGDADANHSQQLHADEIRIRCYVGEGEIESFEKLFSPFTKGQALKVINKLKFRREKSGQRPRPCLSDLSEYILDNHKEIKTWI